MPAKEKYLEDKDSQVILRNAEGYVVTLWKWCLYQKQVEMVDAGIKSSEF